MIRIDLKQYQTVGRVGEKLASTIALDVSAMAAEFPGGSAVLLCKRPNDSEPYPLAAHAVGDGLIAYTLTAAETAQAGMLRFELDWVQGEIVKKSMTFAAQIVDALGDPSDPPEEPVRGWVEAIRADIGDMDDMEVEDADNLVEAVNYLYEHGGGGVPEHNELEGRDQSGAHPMSAISGLAAALAAKEDVIDDLDDIREGAELGATAVQEETDPTVPAWAKASVKPTYTAEEVGALGADTALADLPQDSTHRTVTDAEKAAWSAKAEASAVTSEASARALADNGLQGQIDAIVSKSDVVDVVGTYAELLDYDTSMLYDNDVVKVLSDSTHADGRSYYRYALETDSWTYIGTEGVGYTKAEADALLEDKQDTVSDLATIRSGAALGATAVQPAAIAGFQTAAQVQALIDAAITDAMGDDY